MAPSLPEPQGPCSGAEEHTRTVLDWIQGLLQTGTEEEATIPTLLRDLAKAFGATAAGVAAPLPGPVMVKHLAWTDEQEHAEPAYPWNEKPELLEQVREAPMSLGVRSADGTSWLLTSVWLPHQGGWLLWVQGGSERTWTAGERGVLPVAGQVLARLSAAAGRSWARSLECVRLQRHLEDNTVLIARMAHEFGNILTGILGFAELSLSQLPPDSLPHRYVKEVYQSAQGGARWVHKLQLFSRRTPPPFWPTTLAAVVAGEEARVRLAWGADVAFLLALPADLPALAIDADSLQQILGPLLDNAREAISGQGVITLSARPVELTGADVQEILGKLAAGRYLEITVTDTGAGFTAEARRRLFVEMFFSTKKRYCGLGLAMVYGLLRTFGGGLRFGPDPEQGTAVSIYLPVAGAGAAAPTRPQGSAPAVGRGSRILVIDDDRLILELLAKVLEKAGYFVRTAPGPAEALALFTAPHEHFQLVVTDVVMPQMNGFDLARRMQKHQPGVNLLFISNFPSSSALIPGDLLKEFIILRKPFEPPELLQAVAKSLARSQPK